MSSDHPRGHEGLPAPDNVGLEGRGKDGDPAELDLRAAVDDFTRSLTPADPATALDRLRRVPADGATTATSTGTAGPACAPWPPTSLRSSAPQLPSRADTTSGPELGLDGSRPADRTFLAALLQALVARPDAHDAHLWFVDCCPVTATPSGAPAPHRAMSVLSDLAACLGPTPADVCPGDHALGLPALRTDEDLRGTLWLPTADGSHRRSRRTQPDRTGQDVDVLAEIIACARPFTERPVTDDVRFALTTLRTELSGTHSRFPSPAPRVRFLDFTWPAPVVGRSLADLLQHHAPDAADAWRIWSTASSNDLDAHLTEMWASQLASPHDVTAAEIFVLLSADTCRTLTVPPPDTLHRPDRPAPQRDDGRSGTHASGANLTSDGTVTTPQTATAPDGSVSEPDPTAHEPRTAEPDPPLHTGRDMDDLLAPLTPERASTQAERGKHPHLRGHPFRPQHPARVLDKRTLQAISAHRPGEDTLPAIEQLLLGAAR
ncbi:hypothetical protein [Streptomyces sp. NPDC058867]|uniref:hypothetical protein n=1 Tax=unclassified Streptomyces TaxID=2593676 RepID=UPI0036C4B4D5